MSSIFNLISILYIFRSAQLLVTIWREWAEVIQEPLTRRKKHLAEQASFFIAVPIGVLFHELGHAIAVWFFGGQVIGFNFRFFWGSVEHIGIYTPAERWVISLAGTIGSLLFGVLIWLLLRNNKVSSLRYFGLRAFRFQIYFALLYYPLFTIIFPIGDWRVIYDFSATPLLSSVTLVIHVIFLIFYWRYDRKGSFEAPAMESVAQQAQFDELERQVELNPHDTKAQLQYVDMLHRGGASNRAQTHLKRFLKENPNSAEGYLQFALIASRNHGSKKSGQYANKALELGLSDNFQKALAYELIAFSNMNGGSGDAAIEAFNQAIALMKGNQPTTQETKLLVTLYRNRGDAYRRLRKYDLAYADLTQAINLAQQNGYADMAAAFQQDLEDMEKQTGRKLGTSSQNFMND